MALLERLWRDLSLTMILVTPDAVIAQELAIMSQGRLAVRALFRIEPPAGRRRA